MSTVQTNRIQHSSGTGNNIILSADGDTQVNSLNTGQLAGFRNQLINGDFRIWQRGASFSGSSAAYTADRWYSPSTSGAGVTKTISREATSLSTFSYRFYVASSDNSVVRIRQAIELDATGKAGQYQGQWTFSFYTGDPAPTSIGISFADDRDAANAKSWDIGAITSLGDSRYSVTATAPTPNSSNKCVLLNITPTGTAFGFTGCQFEKGPVATPFEHRPLGTELALCERYTYVNPPAATSSIMSVGNQMSGNTVRASYFFPVTMRVPPTVSAAPQGTVDMNPATWYYISNSYAVAQGVLSSNAEAYLNIAAGTVFDAEL